MRPLIRTAVAGLALLLAACTGSVQDPTPSPTLDADQTAARDVVLTADRDAVHDFAYDVVREPESAKWLISDVAVTPVGGCL